MENEATFVAPEGVYSVIEELKPSILQAHAATSATINYATRITPINVRFPVSKQGGGTPGLAQLLGGGNKDSKKEKEKEKEKEKAVREDGVSLSSSDTADENDPISPELNPSVHNHHLFGAYSFGGKKKSTSSRPKHNIKTTSSTFITRIQYAEGYAKIMQSKQGETIFLFYNQVKTLLWVDAGAKSKEPLARITFSAFPTCHDVNPLTASSDRLDVIVGFSTGDLIWLDPISSRYTRLNKQGCITNSPCTAVRWVPSSTSLFLVSHADGTIVVYDREREDGTFTPQDPGSSSTPPSASVSASNTSSEETWDPTENIFVTMPPWHPVAAASGGAKSDKDKAASVKNPVSHWRVSKRRVVDFVFSPDVKYVGAISEDGCLRVIDALAEQLIDCYASYFGTLTCVAWSPDGRFIVTGGQDDLLTIFSPWEQRVVARCQGHSSFVSSVSFDDLRCDGRTYRFGSVGEDNKLILWDFSSGALHRPKLQSQHQRVSMSSTLSLSAFRRERSAFHLPEGDPDTIVVKFHPAPSRNEVAVVQPVLVKHVDGELLTAISFIPKHLVTSTKNGHLKLWIRPLALRSPRHLKETSSPHKRGHSMSDN